MQGQKKSIQFACMDTVGLFADLTVIYTHGLALMMIFDGQRLPKKEACRMMYNLGVKLSKEIGITPQDDFETIYNATGTCSRKREESVGVLSLR